MTQILVTTDEVVNEPAPARPPDALQRTIIQSGDKVCVYDAQDEKYKWLEVAETKIGERSGRVKIRVVGTDYFFDEGCVYSHESARRLLDAYLRVRAAAQVLDNDLDAEEVEYIMRNLDGALRSLDVLLNGEGRQP